MNSLPLPEQPSMRERLSDLTMRIGLLRRRFAFVLAVLAALSGFLTYAVMVGDVAMIAPKPTNVAVLLSVNLFFLLSLAVVIARRLWTLRAARRQQLAGSGLQTRLVLLFSVVAAVPAIMVAVFSVLFFHYGLQGWFSQRVNSAIEESLAVSEAYLAEHRQVVGGDALAMANDLNREGPILLANLGRLQRLVETHARIRALTEAVVFDGAGRVLARAGFTFGLALEGVPDWAIDRARTGHIPIMTSPEDDRLRALVWLQDVGDVYMYVGRFVEPRVLNHLERVRSAVSEYTSLEGQRARIEITFAMIFATVALLFLLSAIWVGFNMASSLSRPIRSLVEAAERVRAGDLSVRVEAGNGKTDEIATLSRAFNRMTNQLEAQRQELIEANRQLDDRRRFTEAVLGGVASGVIGLDRDGCINLPNRMASELLSTDLEKVTSLSLSEVVPELEEPIEAASATPHRQVERQIRIVRAGVARTLLVRVLAQLFENRISGYVVTFTDITELLSAQRKAAWSDVARRIAHEIKNPLTPIQLSAERLRRKYLPQIVNDPETFQICTDTIVRQVDDLRSMVDEFSSFARLPAPTMRRENLAFLVRQSVFLQHNAHADVTYGVDLPPAPVYVLCDRQQIGQVMTNLLQNAADAIEARPAGAVRGRIDVRLSVEGERVVLSVEDNGVGLPAENRDRLTEPYVTTRSKGTGLGLAIVKKIVEDHAAEFVLEDVISGGARARLLLPSDGPDQAEARADDRPNAAPGRDEAADVG